MKLRERVFLFVWTAMPGRVATTLARFLQVLFRKNRRAESAVNGTPELRDNDEPRSRRSPPLKLYWWRPALGGFRNFGDELSPLLVERLFGRSCIWAPPETCDAVVIGSVLEKVCATRRQSPPLVWGAGFIGDGFDVPNPAVSIAAVRGLLTAKRFGREGSAITGDPGLLCSELLDRPPYKRFEVGIVLHHAHCKFDAAALFSADVTELCTVDVTLPPMQVIQTIAACETVFSTSLHGLVVADSLGIPNQWIKLPKRLFGGDYKFHDYYSSFDGDGPQSLEVDYRRKIDRQMLSRVRDLYSRPGREHIRQNLLASFPECLLSAL